MRTRLKPWNWVALLISGVLLQAASGAQHPWAPLMFFAFMPLLVLARCTPMFVGVPLSLLCVWLGRSLCFTRTIDAAAWVPLSLLAILPIVAHKLMYGRSPRFGTLAFPLTWAVVEQTAQQAQWLPTHTWMPWWQTQANNPGLMMHALWLPPLAMSFVVTWTQSLIAGFGEIHLVDEAVTQAERERGLGQQAMVGFFVMWCGLHATGWLQALLA
jgi:hypothetical protein